MSDSTRGFNRLLHRLRPQLKSLLGADSRDEILTQLNAADEPRPDIGTSRPRNGITLPPFDANTTMCLGHSHPTTVAVVIDCAMTRRSRKGRTVMAVPDRRGYDPIKRRRPTTLDTLRTYDENSRSCSGFHSRQFRETDEDGG
ncbi:PREDICTED: uncharacterized protein LOC108750503 [Trachymyrmex septentrionalis]|uniref:uncharacterized protein LOC108750503 n=1 Tax=Trachymyrmex septentrionalis TaxID=34720 RepID=UPI00084ED34F|nr:PREDICTED: uncharacterized protein LOC108750503 [Trachymyrmex septentrionalis]